MITKIMINKKSSYDSNIEIDLKEINFFYGSNGSGKTTISRALKNNEKDELFNYYSSNDNFEFLVYNNDFVQENFNNNSNIKGIFTLGKGSNDAITKINELELDKKILVDEKEQYLKNITNQNKKIMELEEQNSDICWSYKKDMYSYFQTFFKGKVGSKKDFFAFCRSLKKDNSSYKIEDLVDEYNKLVKSELKEIEEFDYFDVRKSFLDDNSMKLLNEVVKGNDSLEISSFIEKIGSFDWIKEGIKFLDITNNTCPFCQNVMTSERKQQLFDLFDDTYNEMIDKIRSIYDIYYSRTKNQIELINNIIDKYKLYFDVGKIEKHLILYKQVLDRNLNLIETKINKPSISISLENIIDIQSNINDCIIELIGKIKENNNMVNNQQALIDSLRNKVYGYLYGKVENAVTSFNKTINGIEKSIEKFKNEIDVRDEKIFNIKNEVSQLRSSMSGITNTIEEMNKILSSFGFVDFYFSENEDKKTYKVLRSDGTSVGQTLSEGEQRFISFLYFYQLIKGTQNDNGEKNNRVIVIDDPISSLDSNILFIVSTLVKNVIDDCLKFNKNKIDLELSSGIKQVVILTHNVYFLKEITFKSRGSKNKFTNTNTNYFVIQKNNGISKINTYDTNPITTTYDLLWSEIREQNHEKNKGTIFNTMRRILEYYFNILGGLNYEKLISEFEGEDKQLCSSLLSCINDSSHYISDDFDIIFTNELIDKYIRVFKLIFEKTNQINHYNMMMHIS